MVTRMQQIAVGDEETKVSIDKEKRDELNDFGGEIGLQPSADDPDVFVDVYGNDIMIIGSDGTLLPSPGIEDLTPTQEKQYRDRIDGFNAGDDVASQVSDFLDTEPDEERERGDEPQKPDDERVDEPTDTKPQAREQGKITKESIDAIDGEQKRLALQLEAKAPGNDSSAINEIMIGDGMVMFSDDPDRSVEDVADALFESCRATPLGKKNGEEKTRAACVAAAISAKRENVRTQEFLASEEMDADTTEISHVWGSQESLQATVDTLEEAGVEEVNGIPLEEYKKIIIDGGAGANPTDTMIVMIDSSQKPPKAIILHTSNKTSTADIQGNSSPEKNIDFIIEAAKEGNLSDKEKEEIIELAEKTKKALIKKQQEISAIVSNSFNDARDKLKNDEKDENGQTLVEKIKTLSKTGKDPAKYFKIIQKRYTASKNNKNKFAVDVDGLKSELKSKGKSNKEVEKEVEKKLVAAYLDEMEYLATTKNEVSPPTGPMLSILARTALDEEKEEQMNELYREQHDMQNDMRVQMNEVSAGFGDRTMSKNFVSRLHLDVAEGHAPGGIPPKYFELNMGHNKSEMRFDADGQPYIKEDGKFYPVNVETGDVDKDAEPKKISELNSGTTATIGNMDTIAAALGYEIPPPPENIDELIEVGSIESAKSGPGGGAFIYGIRQGGERIVIGFQTIRPKDGKGTRPQDTLKWSNQFQTRLQLASAREAQQESGEQPKKESIIFLGNIISETKQNTLFYHWAKAEENYSVDQFIREINEGSLN